MQHVAYSFIHRCPLVLLLSFGYHEQCRYGHRHTNHSLRHCFQSFGHILRSGNAGSGSLNFEKRKLDAVKKIKQRLETRNLQGCRRTMSSGSGRIERLLSHGVKNSAKVLRATMKSYRGDSVVPVIP